jgi:hypothetical protein
MTELQDDILPRLCNFTDNPILLIEESHTIGEAGYLFRKEGKMFVETGLHSKSYYGFLEMVRMQGIDVVTTRDLNASIWYMISMDNYLGKYHYPHHGKTFKIPNQAIGMISCVPGIGEKRARATLAHQSIRDICKSKGGIEGLTEKQSEKMRRCLEWKGN